jgi:2-keto-3-deoxy-L-rhamnonate aldolase RhmA
LKNLLKSKLNDHPEITESLSLLDFDWFLLDMEHAPLTIASVENLLRSVADRITPIVRVPLNDIVYIKQVLDVGAHGVMVPLVNNREDAERAVKSAKYPPLGIRGIGARRVSSYFTKHREYIESANKETMMIVQIETAEALKNFSEIIDCQGIDAWFIGPGDLAASLGHAGENNSQIVLEAMDSVLKIAKEKGVPGGTIAFSTNSAKQYVEKGYQMVAIGSDIAFLLNGAESAIKFVKSKEV